MQTTNAAMSNRTALYMSTLFDLYMKTKNKPTYLENGLYEYSRTKSVNQDFFRALYNLKQILVFYNRGNQKIEGISRGKAKHFIRWIGPSPSEELTEKIFDEFKRLSTMREEASDIIDQQIETTTDEIKPTSENRVDHHRQSEIDFITPEIIRLLSQVDKLSIDMINIKNKIDFIFESLK